MTNYEPHRAPEHMVDRVLAVMAAPGPDPLGRPPEWHAKAARAQARLIADMIWATAYFAGAADAAGRVPAAVTLQACRDCPRLAQGWLAQLRGTATASLQQEATVTAKNSKQDDEADRRQRAAQAREQARHMREQGNHERAQQLEQEAVNIEQGTTS